MTIPTISTLPTAPARTDPPATFVTRADSFLAALVVMQGELNTSIGAINTEIAGIEVSVSEAEAAQAAAETAEANAEAAVVNAQAAQAAAESAANATLWVSGTSYSAGAVVYSPIDYKSYRANTATSGTTDPSLSNDWTSLSGGESALATLTQTLDYKSTTTLSLSSPLGGEAPIVTATKEIPQTGVTNNYWEVNSTEDNYVRVDSAYATTLDFFEEDYYFGDVYLFSSFSVSAQETQPFSLHFSPDGTHLFTCGRAGDAVDQYALSTAFDISTAAYVRAVAISGQEANVSGIALNNDGTKMFICGFSGRDVNEYTLSTPWNVQTLSFVDSYNVSTQDTAPSEVSFNNDGTKMFVLGATTDTVYQYTLTTGFDVSTAFYSGSSFSVTSQEVQPYGMAFSSDGTIMIISGFSSTGIVYKYTLSTGFDISTASYTGESFSVLSREANPLGLAFNPDGTKVFVIGYNSNDILEYALPIKKTVELGTGSFASEDVGKTIEANNGKIVLIATDGTYKDTITPTSFDQVASGSWEMYGLIYNSSQDNLQLSAYTDSAFNITAGSFVQSFSVSSQGTNLRKVVFSPDGTKMFTIDSVNDRVYQYSLSTSYDISTASYTGISISVASQAPVPIGLTFNNDGTKMFVTDSSNDSVHEYSLSTGFDISTASFSDSASVLSAGGFPSGIKFNRAGNKMYISDLTADAISEYSLSTSFDVSTISFSHSFSVVEQDNNPTDIAFTPDGSKMFLVGNQNDLVYEYSLSTSYDISTASYTGRNFSVASEAVTPYGIVFSADGTQMFIAGLTNSSVFEYSVGTAIKNPSGYQVAHTKTSIDSTYWTDINSMTANQDAGNGNVYYAISTDDRTTWTVIDNTDGERDIVRNNAGTWQYNSNGTYASETWTNATTNTELAALAEAMEGAEDAVGFVISNASYSSVSLDVSGQETGVDDVAFNSDGTKMYVIGFLGDEINQYSLSTGFDLSTASFDSVTFSVASQDTSPQSLAFNSDGTKMYVVGDTNNTIYQYTLSTGFDLSTASYASISFSVASQDTSPKGIAFNTDGTKMYVCGDANDAVYQYTLSTGFDLSTASYDSVSFDISTQDSQVRNVSFNQDGSKMFVLGLTNSSVFQYSLTSNFNISTSSYDAVSFSFAAQETNTQGMAFSADGTKMYLAGNTDPDKIYQYSSSTTTYINQMDKTQLDAVTDPNHITLGNDLDLAIAFNLTSGAAVPSSDGVSINYDANILNQGAVLGTDYDFDSPADDKVRITALTPGNYKVRVL